MWRRQVVEQAALEVEDEVFLVTLQARVEEEISWEARQDWLVKHDWLCSCCETLERKYAIFTNITLADTY